MILLMTEYDKLGLKKRILGMLKAHCVFWMTVSVKHCVYNL